MAESLLRTWITVMAFFALRRRHRNANASDYFDVRQGTLIERRNLSSYDSCQYLQHRKHRFMLFCSALMPMLPLVLHLLEA